ncbi:MAG: DUF1844 domain-containing protein [bacterium]|nr:DUF1844 domain-containing protein [bacterium]
MAEREEGSREQQEGSDVEIKVTDRRLFNLEGELRGSIEADDADPAEETSETAAEAPAPTPQAPEPVEAAAEQPQGEPGQFEHRPVEDPPGVSFAMLVGAMAEPALMFLGEHPETGEQEVNLERARVQIDLLETLRIKCRGNLSTEEEDALERLLYQLRMFYVSRSGGAPG